jgi:3-oxoacyl-[acyl-carrier-protein] synthase-1
MGGGIFLSAPGLVCCAGRNRDEFYESCLKGDQRGIVKRTIEGKTFLAGIIPGELPPADSSPLREAPAYTGNTRFIRMIDAALEQIRPEVEAALARYGGRRIGVCVGSCDNGSEGSLLAHEAWFATGSFPKDYELRFQSAGFPGEYISRKFGLSGPSMGIAAACASGADAIVRGAELIRAGFCDAVIAGGADIVSDTVLLGFDSLEAVSGSLTNPFSKNRKGINLGEAAAFFVMTAETGFSMETGGASVELLGAGESADAFHMTSPREDGRGAIRAMEAALKDAGIGPEEVDYVNLHGTGTILNDRMEALAMDVVFLQEKPPASSTKPVTGHTLGAAGALEAALCALILRRGEGLPVHCWDGVYDEELPALHFVPAGEHGKSGNKFLCMSNSFAVGGCNTSLVLGKKGLA